MIQRLQQNVQRSRAVVAACDRSITHVPASQRKEQRVLAGRRLNARRKINASGAKLLHWYTVPGDVGPAAFLPSIETLAGNLADLQQPVPWDPGANHSEGSAQAQLAEAQSRAKRCLEEQQLVRREAIDAEAFHAYYMSAIQVKAGSQYIYSDAAVAHSDSVSWGCNHMLGQNCSVHCAKHPRWLAHVCTWTYRHPSCSHWKPSHGSSCYWMKLQCWPHSLHA